MVKGLELMASSPFFFSQRRLGAAIEVAWLKSQPCDKAMDAIAGVLKMHADAEPGLECIAVLMDAEQAAVSTI